VWGEEDLEDELPFPEREGRYGKDFGTVVHRAMEWCVRDRGLAPARAVGRAMQEVGLREHRDEAVGDVERGLAALEREGLLGEVGATLRLEYPIAGSGGEEQMLLGYVDLVRVDGEEVTVIDYKTDLPPSGPVATAMPDYVAQVRRYGRLLAQAGIGGGRVRCGLLFTGDGSVGWVA
jgi:ATP-dependent exoDNAse (exonuclease V) beta subunit